MINIEITKNIIECSREYHLKTNLGKRGEFDGSNRKQFIGIIAENTVRNYYGFELMQKQDGWDGGFDILWNGLKTDIKSTERKWFPKKHWHSSVPQMQIKYKSEAYIFTSLNVENKVLTICGWITKKEFTEKSIFNKKGNKMFGDKGNFSVSTVSSYQIKYLDLNPPLFNFEINN